MDAEVCVTALPAPRDVSTHLLSAAQKFAEPELFEATVSCVCVSLLPGLANESLPRARRVSQSLA